ncbi:MAG: type I 3-dehydroquinate dehydratase [Deltaproteobacteria bacterium]|nr:type I 3-dehydroquinate dehydratase [Deltaproteobacteria bacterium]
MKKGYRAPGPVVAGVIVGELKGSTVKKAIRDGADILEVRVDTFKDRDPEAIKKDLKTIGSALPLLLTVRSVKEGGANPITDKKRAEIFEALMPFADMVDIELSSGGILKTVVNSASRHGKQVIISYHNFKATPGVKALQDIVRKARRSGAGIVKIATFVKGPEDLRRLAKILSEFNDLIVIGMGGPGACSRVFFPMLGSLITYGSIDRPTAPGQIALKEIKKEFGRYGFQRPRS